uniref:Cytochrome P450 monooxygenase n=1 Tax=Fusarium anthophilum TaxID=48485 RepID=V9TKE6_9HYPO|nr:cytochrome P450 monooxygenase [Fusarium anthophilum]
MALSTTNLGALVLFSGLGALVVPKHFPEVLHFDFLGVKISTAGFSSTLLITLTINSALLLFYAVVIHPAFVSPLRNIPRVKMWLSRAIYELSVNSLTPGELFLKVANETPNNGILALKHITGTYLLVTKGNVLPDLLVHRSYEFTKPDGVRAFLQNFLGSALFTCEGEHHKFLRKINLPIFSFRRVKDMYPMMWKGSLAYVDALEEEISHQSAEAASDGGSAGRVDISRWATSSTLNVMGNATFGMNLSDVKYADDIKQVYKTLFDPTKEMLLYYLMSIWTSFDLVSMLPWDVSRIFQENSKKLRSIYLQLAQKGKRAVKSGDGGADILSLLVKSEALSDEEIAEHLLTYLAAGQDTTSVALTWACFLLALHPDQQDALRMELRRSIPSNHFPTASSTSDESTVGDIGSIMERLPLLNGVINETLRLYPPLPVTLRTAVCDTFLGEQPIPKGTQIIISTWAINRSAEVWGDDATVFRPERWIDPVTADHEADPAHKADDEGADRKSKSKPATGKPNHTGGAKSNYDFMTFLHGPRGCIGKMFAQAELRCLLVALVTRFRWTLDMKAEDVRPIGAITINPSHLYLKLEVVKD